MGKCAVLHCDSDDHVNYEPPKSFHKFPISDPNRLEKWLSELHKNRPGFLVNRSNNQAALLCSDHFKTECYVCSIDVKLLNLSNEDIQSESFNLHHQKGMKLKCDAVPTIFRNRPPILPSPKPRLGKPFAKRQEMRLPPNIPAIASTILAAPSASGSTFIAIADVDHPGYETEFTPRKQVSEIFAAAGVAFTELGELTKQLQSVNEPLPSTGKWTTVEIEMLRKSLTQFGDGLDKVSECVKHRIRMQSELKLAACEMSDIHSFVTNNSNINEEVISSAQNAIAIAEAEDPSVQFSSS